VSRVSTCNASLSESTNALAAPYTAIVATGWNAAVEEMLTTAPCPAATMLGRAARVNRSDRNAIQRDFRGDAIARLIDETSVVTRTCIVDQQIDTAAREPFDDGARSVGGGQIGSDGVEPAVGVVTGELVANAREAVGTTCDEDDVVVGRDSSGESGTGVLARQGT